MKINTISVISVRIRSVFIPTSGDGEVDGEVAWGAHRALPHVLTLVPTYLTPKTLVFECVCIYFNPQVLEWIGMKLSLISLQSTSTHVD
jgi:hypothetical protein